MSKKDRKQKAERRLAKAQLDLHLAQEKRTRAMAKGEREVEKARQRAAQRIARSTERVERMAGRLTRAEVRLAAIAGPPRRRRRAIAPVTANPSVLITPDGIPLPVSEVPPDVEEEAEAGAPIVSAVQISGEDILSEDLGASDGPESNSSAEFDEPFPRRSYGTRRRVDSLGGMAEAGPENGQSTDGATDGQ